MGRKINRDRLVDVWQTIKENDTVFRSTDVAKKLSLHPQAIARLLTAFEDETEYLLIEDDKGFLGIFKK